MTEAVRLVIWDLDETFWQGTLTEGGITLRPEVCALVENLARRGIISSICSKNDHAPVREILENAGIWEYFIFPSISWEPKGPRIAALIEMIQLRSATVMFIDDNPANLNEARHYTPDLQIAPETFITSMLDDLRFKGKDDQELSRLKQYQSLSRRKQDEVSAGDVTAFLRSSGIRVEISYDVNDQLGRTIELINRTNQLNFTKVRLSEEPEIARAELLDLLNRTNVHVGLLRVTDNYGDHGFCGLYVTTHSGQELIHFCFSCRILGMGIETWIYNRIGRPRLNIIGDVLTNPITDTRPVDWISASTLDPENKPKLVERLVDTIVARGGCDLAATIHYLGQHAQSVVSELNEARNGVDVRTDHSIFIRNALSGIDEKIIQAFQLLGYRSDDLKTSLFSYQPGRVVWLLSFWQESEMAMYRHRRTQVLVPFGLPDIWARKDATTLRVDDLKKQHRSGWVADSLRNVCEQFEYAGVIQEEHFKKTLRLTLEARPPNVEVFVVGQNDRMTDPSTGYVQFYKECVDVNRWINEVAKEYNAVTVIPIRDCIQNDSEVIDWRHFGRLVYYRLYHKIAASLRSPQQLGSPEMGLHHSNPAKLPPLYSPS